MGDLRIEVCFGSSFCVFSLPFAGHFGDCYSRLRDLIRDSFQVSLIEYALARRGLAWRIVDIFPEFRGACF